MMCPFRHPSEPAPATPPKMPKPPPTGRGPGRWWLQVRPDAVREIRK